MMWEIISNITIEWLKRWAGGWKQKVYTMRVWNWIEQGNFELIVVLTMVSSRRRCSQPYGWTDGGWAVKLTMTNEHFLQKTKSKRTFSLTVGKHRFKNRQILVQMELSQCFLLWSESWIFSQYLTVCSGLLHRIALQIYKMQIDFCVPTFNKKSHLNQYPRSFQT